METKRLILRKWKDDDAEELYKYASNPDVGPIAGWPPHKSIEESRDVIKNVLNGKEAYAICLKEDGKAIGAIELKLNG
ncbi:MAG: GNAT family N-acetyltransferase, partial [Treponema sp.]|nr:GNAT family N-acetyltransferase [Treponema sp.]